MTPRKWPISGIPQDTSSDTGKPSHAAAMKAAGWVPVAVAVPRLRPGRRPYSRFEIQETEHGARAQVGCRVLVSLSNGAEFMAIVRHVYKNRARRVDTDDGRRGVHEHPTNLWVRAEKV